MLAGFAKRVGPTTFTDRLEMFSDGNDDYTYVLPEFFRKDCIDYGQLVKIREKGRVVDKIHRVVYGSPSIEEIETS